MQSVSALDLVSGALKSTLARAQKNYDFNSSSSKLKKNNRIKDESDNLERESGREKDFNYWNIAVKSNKLQFSTSGYQLSSFISTIRSKYECLNPSETENSQKTNHHKKIKNLKPKFLVGNKLRGKNKSGKSSVKNDIPVENADTQPVQDKLKKIQNNSSKNQNSHSKLFTTPNEIFEKLKERRKEVRRKKKEVRRLARLEKLKAVEPNLFYPDIVGKREKENKNFLPLTSTNHLAINNKSKSFKKNRIMKETSINSANIVNGGNSSNSNQLSQPRVVLFPRSKVVPGWQTKFPVGSGLINLGNSCYMNASLQALFHTPAFVNWLLDDNEHRQHCRNSGQCFQSCIICAMNNILKESLGRNGHCVRPVQIHTKLKVICKHFTHGRQEDAHEFLRYLLESMERSYLTAINSLRLDNRSKETTPLGQIFGGYLRTEVTCLKCNFISTTFQPLAELQLDIRHVTTLEDAIQNHFKKERLDNNDYKCEKCHTISPATKQFSLEIPPIVLCLQLKRFTLYGNKITKPIHCNRSLNLTRYLHKSHQEVGQGDIKYKLVALVTHMGSSPNCGHYTAIAEASNGSFYQFDDAYVRQVSTQTALNTDAYVIIYEMDRNQNQIGATQNVNQHFNGKPATVTSSLQTITSPISVNGNTNNLGRLDSPAPVPKRFSVPFLKSPVSESSALRNSSMGSPSVPNTSMTSKLNTINSITSSKPVIGINTAPSFEWTRVPNSLSNSLAPVQLVDQQYGVKRKLEDVMEKKDTAKLESKQPRLITSVTSGTVSAANDTTTVLISNNKTNGTVQPVSSTSNWKVIPNGKSPTISQEKSSENLRKTSKKSGGYCSDPETNKTDNSKHFDFHRAKSVERLLDSHTNKTDILFKKCPEKDSMLNRSPEKLRKSPKPELSTHVNGFAQNGESKIKDVGISTSVYTNGKASEQKRVKDTNILLKPRQESPVKVVLENKPSTSSSSSESSSDEKRKSKTSKHKRKAKRGKSKKKRKKHHKKSSSSSSSSSSSESESETADVNKNKHKPRFIDKIMDKSHKSNKKHKNKNGSNSEEQSPHTHSTDMSEDGNRKQQKSYDKSEGLLPDSDIIRSMSEERERDRRKNRNPSRSRSPERKDVIKESSKFDVSKLLTRDKQIASWNGTESTLSKSIDIDRKSRKNKGDELDEEMDAGRVKKSRKSRSPSRDTDSGTSGNKFQNYEDKRRSISDWGKVLYGSDGYGENSRDHKYPEKGNGKSSGDYHHKIRSGNNFFSSGGSSSHNFHGQYGHRSNSQFRNGKGGRSNFGRSRHENRNYHHSNSNSFRRDNRDRRPS